MPIKGVTSSLRVYGVVELRKLPETELQLNLVLHVHNVSEGLDELRRSIGSTLCETLEVRPGEPICHPETNVEPAVGLLFNQIEQLPLSFRAQVVLHSHSSEL